ncbi:MAG: XTP/dITP diphosphohydrolase [Limisphaerales bacterium]|jgi:XTP/dITP diphosphohydrolase
MSFQASKSIEAKRDAFQRILAIMDELREECPWDKKQTMESLRSLTIEETYELADAILDKDRKGIKEELGDLLLHIVFYARIGDEDRDFDIVDVINGLCEKLIHRHPHIYGDVKVKDEEEVKRNWEKLKLKEGKKSVLEGVPKSLPAMIKALRIQEKSAKVGFEWEKTEEVWEKVEEEKAELLEAVDTGDPSKMEDEFGDLLFALINYSRFINVDPETALERTNKKFITRFEYIEAQAKVLGRSIDDMSLEEMDALWNEAKKQ